MEGLEGEDRGNKSSNYILITYKDKLIKMQYLYSKL